jgi:hypothetical protein
MTKTKTIQSDVSPLTSIDLLDRRVPAKRGAKQLTIFGIPADLDESLPENEIHLDLPDGSTHIIKLDETIFVYK